MNKQKVVIDAHQSILDVDIMAREVAVREAREQAITKYKGHEEF